MIRRLALNSLSGSGLFVVNLVVAFLLSPVMVRTLGNTDYGVWEILIALFGYFSILDLGVAQAIVRFVAQAAGRDDHERINRIASSALLGLGLSGIVALAAVAAVSFIPEQFMDLEPDRTREVRTAIFLVGVNLVICLPGFVFSAHLFGLQRHRLVNGVQSVLGVLQGAAIYLILTRTDGPYLVYLSLVLAGSNLVNYTTLAAVSMSSGLRIHPRHVRREQGRELYRYGVQSVMLTVADRIQGVSVPMVIGAVLGAGMVVFYALPNRLVTYANGLIGALTLPLTPYFSFMEGEARTPEDDRRAWLGLTRSLQFLLVGIAVAIIGLGEPFIARWIGPEYADEGRWVTRILGATLFIEALAPAARQFLLGRGIHGNQARVSVVLGVLGVVLYGAGGMWFGLTGVAVAFGVVRALTLGAGTYFACRGLDLSPGSHIRLTLARFAAPGAVSLAALIGLRIWRFPGDYPGIVGYGLITAAVYAVLCWVLALTGAERAGLRRLALRARSGQL